MTRWDDDIFGWDDDIFGWDDDIFGWDDDIFGWDPPNLPSALYHHPCTAPYEHFDQHYDL